ncbi:MAG: CHASE2 domain-containing protein [Syntrophomonadaceae bacterium]
MLSNKFPDKFSFHSTISTVTQQRLFIPIILLLFIQLLVSIGLFTRLEMKIYDYWFRLSGVENPGEEVIVIAIDDYSIEEIGPLAWPRSVHAGLLDKLSQARIVTFDITFPSAKNQAEDEAFAQAIEHHGRVVLPFEFGFETAEDGEKVQFIRFPHEMFMMYASGIGFVNTPTDIDQVVRRTTLIDVNTYDFPIPSLDLATYLAAHNLTVEDLQVIPGYLCIRDYHIPIDQENKALPTFWGPRETFKYISYVDVLNGKISPDYFQNKIVIIGSVTQTEHDVFATPYTTSNMVKHGSPETPGVEIHAAITQSLLSNRWYQPVKPAINFLFLLFSGIFTTLMVSRRGPWKGLLGSIFVIILDIALVFGIWHYHWWLNLAAPLVLVFLTYVVVTATDFIQAEMERRKTRAVFSRYVSPDIVEELMKNPDSVELGGTKKIVTIMFADIRGFTAYSENKDPVDVINRLNEYLTVMTRTIQKYGGTLDKYLGDGLMAFFGAPVDYEDHAQRAINAAAGIQDEINKLNKIWEEKDGSPPLLVAVGINTGPAVVGNVGSPERMDYTLIGEDVNLASRTEALTKLFETLILVSERTYNVLPEGEVKNSLYYVGEELVKGFTHPIKVYSLSGLNLHFEKSQDKGFK